MIINGKREELKTLFTFGLVLFPFIMAISKLFTGIITFSVFWCIYAFYDIGIGFAKVISFTRKMEKSKNEEDYSSYVIGWLIIASSFVFMIFSARVFLGYKVIVYSLPIAILIAVCTFIQLFIVLSGFANLKKSRTINKALWLVNLSSTLISLDITRDALLSITVKENFSFSAGLAGLMFGGITVCIGIYLIVSSFKTFKRNNQIISHFMAWQLARKSILDLFKKMVIFEITIHINKRKNKSNL